MDKKIPSKLTELTSNSLKIAVLSLCFAVSCLSLLLLWLSLPSLPDASSGQSTVHSLPGFSTIASRPQSNRFHLHCLLI